MTSAAERNRWTSVAFGDVVRLSKQRSSDLEADGFNRFVGLEHIDPGYLKIRRWGNVADGTTFSTVFRPGHVLFGKRRAYQRKVAVPDFSGVCSGDIYVFEPKTQRLMPELLPFICQSDAFFDHAVGTSAGSLSPRTNWDSLSTFRFALPPPDEQATYVSTLAAAWRVVESASDVEEAIDRARKAFIFRVYEHGLRSERREQTPIGPLPISWEIAPLGDRYHVQLGKMMSDAARRASQQVSYIRNANVQWNRLELDDVAKMSFSDVERQKFVLKHGDILACEGRHVGKAALWRDEIPGACYQKALHRLRRLHDRDVPEYLLHCLQYYSWAGRFIAETGETTIPHLPAERLRAMRFPFPPSDQQREIAEAIGSFDDALRATSHRLDAGLAVLRNLQQALESS